MKCLVCLLEEQSANEMLKNILPNILPENVEYIPIVFEGKQDLEKQLERKIKFWQRPESVFLVMRDKDAGDCYRIKEKLLEKVKSANKESVTKVRIACHELESFYLGDLEAVEKGLKTRKISAKQVKNKFRNPDSLANASEELYTLTDKKYQKVAGSRSISRYLKLDNTNKSHSFNVLINGIRQLVDENF